MGPALLFSRTIFQSGTVTVQAFAPSSSPCFSRAVRRNFRDCFAAPLPLPSRIGCLKMHSRFHATFAGSSQGSKFWLRRPSRRSACWPTLRRRSRPGPTRTGWRSSTCGSSMARSAPWCRGGPHPAADRGSTWSGAGWPCPADLHTHLDKSHIWPRQENPDGTFMGALKAVERDRETNWSAGDVAARMEFGLKCTYAHGTRCGPHPPGFARQAGGNLVAGVRRDARTVGRPDHPSGRLAGAGGNLSER